MPFFAKLKSILPLCNWRYQTGSASSDPETTSVVLSQLKQLRLATAIDDYETGALSLSQLRHAAVDLL